MSARPALEARFALQAGRGSGAFALEAELDLDGGVLVLFGPSGAGKTLTLRALASTCRRTAGASATCRSATRSSRSAARSRM
jgi:molybdate transport system ATP-binding protein